MALHAGDRPGRRQVIRIGDTGSFKGAALLLHLPVAGKAGVVIRCQIIVHIGRIFDIPGGGVRFQLVMAPFGCAALDLILPIPFMVA
jgi:hypothetical protein